jgi:ribosome-associated translation inhibitor RaiA
VLTELEMYLIANPDVDYHVFMRKVETYYSGKLGGIYAYINKALDHLKQEIRAHRKKLKNKS